MNSFDRQYFEDPEFPPGLKGGDEVRGYGYYPDYFPVVEAQLSSLIELTGATSLLDVGCGKGALVAYARRDLGLTQALGMDGSAYAVAHAHRQFGGAWTVRADCAHVPLASGSLELVWCNGVLQYCEAHAARSALAEMARVGRRAAFISNIAAAQRQTEWGRRDQLTRLYLRPAQWATLASACVGPGWRAAALPFEGESAILLHRPEDTLLPVRLVELALERMQRLGALRRTPPGLDEFYRRQLNPAYRKRT